MSTKERYGNEVWRAVVELSYANGVNTMRLLTVGEVSRKAGMARETAKKHMMTLVRHGVMATFPVGKRWVYQYIGDGVDI